MDATGASFESEARQVLGRVRGAYVRMVGAVGGASRPVDLQQALDLDKKLAWRVHRLTTAADPLQGAPYVPSPTSARRLAGAAEQRGVSDELTADLLAATDEFERLVSLRAGDRASFEAIAAALSGQGLDQLQQDARRAAFRANVLLHGKQSDLLVSAFLAGPSDEPGRFDGASLRGHVGLQRLHPDAAVQVARHRFDVDGRPLGRPLALDDQAQQATGAPLIAAFSDAVALEEDEADGFQRLYLAHRDLGLADALTCVLGERSPAMPLDEGLGSLCELATPARLLVHDLILHRDLDRRPPELRVVASRAQADRWPAERGPEVLSPGASVACLGQGLDAAGLPAWSRYQELLTWTAGRMGWEPDDLEVHRVVIEYPVLHSVVWLRSPPG